MSIPHVRQSLVIGWDQILVQMVALPKEETCFEGCRSSSNSFSRRRSTGSTVDRRAFGQYHFASELLIFHRDAICCLVGEVFITVWLHMLEIAVFKVPKVLTRHPTKCARTTRLEAYVKVAPVSGSTYFRWDLSFTNASSSLQSLPWSKRSAGSASQNFRITACSVLAIAHGPIRTRKYFALADIRYRLKMHSVIFLYHVYVLKNIFGLARLFFKERRLILSN